MITNWITAHQIMRMVAVVSGVVFIFSNDYDRAVIAWLVAVSSQVSIVELQQKQALRDR